MLGEFLVLILEEVSFHAMLPLPTQSSNGP